MTLPKPYHLENWLVWPDTTFSDIDYSTCSSTPTGYCPDSLTLQQCINQCKSNDCTYGYFVEFPDKSTLCNPILSNTYGDINPVYGLINKKEFPDLKNTNITTFIDSDHHIFPPKHANIMFYTDIFQIISPLSPSKPTNSNDKEYGISSEKLIPDDQDIVDITSKLINLQIFPHNISIPFIQKYVPVRYGDYINLCIPNTTLLLSKNTHLSHLEWKINSSNIPYTDFAFSFIPLPSTKKKIGDIIQYTDKFNIVYSENYVVSIKTESTGTFNINNTNNLILKYFNVSDIPVSTLQCTFYAKSSMYGYFCDNNVCTPIEISKINYDSTYKNNLVYRSPNCLLQCNDTSLNISNIKPKNNNLYYTFVEHNSTIVIILIIILLSVFVFNLFYISKLRKR